VIGASLKEDSWNSELKIDRGYLKSGVCATASQNQERCITWPDILPASSTGGNNSAARERGWTPSIVAHADAVWCLGMTIHSA
jgi:hypothetical protein